MSLVQPGGAAPYTFPDFCQEPARRPDAECEHGRCHGHGDEGAVAVGVRLAESSSFLSPERTKRVRQAVPLQSGDLCQESCLTVH